MILSLGPSSLLLTSLAVGRSRCISSKDAPPFDLTDPPHPFSLLHQTTNGDRRRIGAPSELSPPFGPLQERHPTRTKPSRYTSAISNPTTTSES